MLALYPGQLHFLDHYSNILYNLGDHERLAFVGQLASDVDRYRPETSCIIGNYYSLVSRHHEAVRYFRHALTLDRSFSSVWTLLGHEYLKLENIHAAIESYRQALEFNQKDYRAHFGLAQAYESLDKHNFSLDYYRRAAELCPADTNIWQALASCYSNQNLFQQAISALKTALYSTDSILRELPDEFRDIFLAKCRYAEILFQLSMVSESLGDRDEAIGYLEICLTETADVQDTDKIGEEQRNSHNSILHKARLLLAQWAMEDGDYSRAQHIASQIDGKSDQVTKAAEILRTIEQVKDGSSGVGE